MKKLKNNKKVTRNVIVIETEYGFAFAAKYRDTLDYSEDIKNADEFDSFEIAQKQINDVGINGEVKRYSYEVDEAFLLDAENILQLK